MPLRNIALYLFFFCLTFEVWDPLNTNGSFSISKLTGWIYALAMAPQIMRSRIGGRTTAFLKPILLLFGLFTTMSVLNSEQGSESVVDLTILQNVVLFWLLLIHVRTEPLVLEKGMLQLCSGFGCNSLVMFRAGIGVGYDALGRAAS